MQQVVAFGLCSRAVLWHSHTCCFRAAAQNATPGQAPVRVLPFPILHFILNFFPTSLPDSTGHLRIEWRRRGGGPRSALYAAPPGSRLRLLHLAVAADASSRERLVYRRVA